MTKGTSQKVLENQAEARRVRRAVRAKQGTLKAQQVSTTVRRRYLEAVAALLFFWSAHGYDPANCVEIDKCSALFVEYMYENGEPYTAVSNALAGLQFLHEECIVQSYDINLHLNHHS